MKRIPLHNRAGDVVAFALVDDADYPQLTLREWQLTGSGYASRSSSNGKVLMHRLIMETPKGYVVDHIDRNRLNNCRSNLRNTTQSENNRNRRSWAAAGDHTHAISFSITKQQLRRVEQLARNQRMKTGENANRSSEVGRAIDALFLAERLTDETNDAPEGQPAADIAA